MYWLDDSCIEFPATHLALDEPNGLLAIGGDLSPDRLINAYCHGIFPWYNEDEEQNILWWTPSPRAVIIPDQLHISRSFSKFLRNTAYTHSFNRDFPAVLSACQAPRATQDGTWIGSAMKDAYVQLHQQGFAHSIEIWDADNRLVGGLYGLALGRVFFGESMFSRTPNASKCALYHLCNVLIEKEFSLLDCQVESPHIMRMGAILLNRNDFEYWLRQAINTHTSLKTTF
ncbi:MAG: leucyl/phenylalanyl-tRNA--protein transferase [Pseudomonadota bacterium]